MGDGRGENACKAFSKDLIVRAIGRASPDPSEGGEGLAEESLLKLLKQVGKVSTSRFAKPPLGGWGSLRNKVLLCTNK